MWPTSEGRPAATACVRQPSACSVGHVVLAMAGERCGAKRDGVHATPLAAGALSTSARATSAAAATKAFMARVYRLADAASRSPRGPCRILERVALREGRRLAMPLAAAASRSWRTRADLRGLPNKDAPPTPKE